MALFAFRLDNSAHLSRGISIFVALSLFLVWAPFVSYHRVSAASNNTVNFQGKIVVKAGGHNVHANSPPCVVDSAIDTCAFRVNYYDSSSGGTLLWSETFLNKEIGDYEGLFNLALGTGGSTSGSETSFENIFINHSSVYLEMEFDPSGSHTFASPEVFTVDGTNRMIMKAAPYAIRANVADQITASNNQFIKNQTTPQLGSNFNVDGNGVIAGSLNVKENSLYVNATTGNVGIGTASPNSKLTVEGSLAIIETGADAQYHTIFQGADQSADIIYTLPGASTNGFLRNVDGALSWTTLDTSLVSENGNLYFTDSRARNAISSTATGLSYDNGTGVFSLASGYVIPTTAQQTAWHSINTDTATDGTVFTVGDGSTTFNVNTSATNDTIVINGSTYNTTLTFMQATSARTINFPNATGTVAVSVTSPLALSSAGNLSMAVASSTTNGYLSAGNFTIFNNKQAGDVDLTALAGFSGTGFAVRTASDTWAQRSITTSGDGISISNGDGVAGNPTISLSIGSGSTQVAAGDHNHSLDTLSNVSISSNGNGQLLMWNGSAWVNATLSTIGIEPAQTKGNISSTTTGITINNGNNSTVGPNVTLDIDTASGSNSGLLDSADWTAFNNKQDALTTGNITSTTISVTGGTGAVIGSGVTLSLPQSVATTATPSFNGFNINGANNRITWGSTVTGSLEWSPATTSKTITLPNNSGTVALTSDLHAIATLGTANGLSLVGQQLSLTTASGSSTGALLSSDWTIFNNKQASLSFGNVTSTTSGISITGGTGAVIGSGVTVNVQTASGGQPGLLSSTDWTTFNNKAGAVSGVAGDLQFNGGSNTLAASSLLHWSTTNNNLGVGLADTAAAYALGVNRTMEIRNPDQSTTNPSEIVFTNTAGTGNFRIRGDGNDIFWQGGGSNSLQMGSYWPTVIQGDVQTTTLPSYIAGSGGVSMIVLSPRGSDVVASFRGFSGQTAALSNWTDATGATVYANIAANGAFSNTATGNAITLSGAGANIAFTGAGLAQITSAINQNIALMPAGTGNVGINTTTNTDKLGVSQTVSTTSYNGVGIDYVQSTNAANITGAALDIAATGSNDAGDTLYGLKIDNLTASASVDYAINIGTGWDREINFTDATVNWGFADGAVLGWTDGTNNLLLAKDLSTNFGLAVEAGAFINRNSYWNEEFRRFRVTLSADNIASNTGSTANLGYGWGDIQGLGVDENTVCTFSTPTGANAINGIGRITNAAANSSCLAYSGTNTANTALTPFYTANLPVYIAKVRPNMALSNNNRVWVGLSTIGAAQNSNPTAGVYFTNDSSGNWVGVTSIAGGTSTTVSCGVLASNTRFALLKAEITAASSVTFYVDADVSDGINWTTCGTSTQNIPTTSYLSAMMMEYSTTINNSMDVDFFRVWQDDSVSGPEASLVDNVEMPVQTVLASQINENGDLVIGKTDDSKTVMTFKFGGGVELDSDLHTNGAVMASCVGIGSGSACNASIAQVYNTSDSVVPGDVVSMTLGGINKVSKTQTRYDTNILGVVVEQPGITLDSGNVQINTVNIDSSQPSVAFAGIAKIKISHMNGPILKGDYLVGSEIAGVAVKAVRPGYAVAQALEDYDSEGIGDILATIKVGFVDPQNLLGKLPDEMLEIQSQLAKINDTLNNGDVVNASELEQQKQLLVGLQSKLGILLQSDNVKNVEELMRVLSVVQNPEEAGLDVQYTQNVVANGALIISSDVNILGDATFNGNVFMSENSAGRALIKANEATVHVTFTKALPLIPVVNITPGRLINGGYYVTNESQDGFDIVLEHAQNAEVSFNWQVVLVKTNTEQVKP